jgi:hypothetical protein
MRSGEDRLRRDHAQHGSQDSPGCRLGVDDAISRRVVGFVLNPVTATFSRCALDLHIGG